MKIRFGEGFRHWRPAEALQALAPLDPAHFVAQFSRHADVVILALRDVQNLFLLVAERRLAAEVVSEEARVRLWILGLVDGDAVMEGLPQSVGAGSIGNPVEV